MPSRQLVRLGAEDVDQGGEVHPVHMLGVERQAGLVHGAGDAVMDLAQAADRR
ncbi:MAG: hypothetical protein ACMVO3_10255 [Thalassobaculum sp.]